MSFNSIISIILKCFSIYFNRSIDAITSGQTDLILIDGSKLAPFEALDDDAGIFGDVTFELSSENGDNTHFMMVKLNRKQSELKAKDEIEEGSYNVRFSSN